ncbi:unnamed protein product [Paramecium pentaurelia]|uniref:Uncharacterized protein n=1 Tax=Paramecium pentaurelia TaxID=43138 RepID=A0A8S1WZ86_9CILI|nr:unnamed protein product [Paramecium pentaurelia]
MLGTPSLIDFFNQDSFVENNQMDLENIDELESQFNYEYTKQPTTTTRHDTIKINEKDINYKNLPKMIGNNFVKWIKNYKYSSDFDKIPKGIKKLVELREKERQSKIKIKDLRESIINDEDSQIIFKEYIADQLYLDLLFSNKVADPFSYIPGISNYYSAANEPEKMKSNYIMRKEFINQ